LGVNQGILSRMDFIENTFQSPKDLDMDTAKKLVDDIAIITKSYDALANVYDLSKDRLTERKLRIIKNMSFFMRE